MNQLASIPQVEVTVKQILELILTKVQQVDFKARITQTNRRNLNLRERDYIVLVIEDLLKLAKACNTKFGICDDSLYLYLGTHWYPIDDEHKIKSFLSYYAFKAGVDFTDACYAGFQESLLVQLSARATSIKAEEKSFSINLQNGTFLFDNGELRPHSAAYGFTYVLPYKYDPSATCPLFDKYLKKVLPEQACQDIIAEYIGSIFIPASMPKLEKVLLLYGGGSNGKSVLFDVINALLGHSNISSFSLRQLTDDSGYSRARFSGMLLNYTSEISKEMDTSLFKQLVSREPIAARLPYGNPFTMRDYGKMMFNCNELPDVEHTNGFFRRFLIVPFDVIITETEQDSTLAKRIVDTELSGILNWMIRGRERILSQQHFTISAKVAEQVQQYKKDSDSVKGFLFEQYYTPGNEKYLLSHALYQDYKRYCEQGGYKSVNERNFRKRLGDVGFEITRHNAGGYKVYLKQEPQVQKVEVVESPKQLF